MEKPALRKKIFYFHLTNLDGFIGVCNDGQYLACDANKPNEWVVERTGEAAFRKFLQLKERSSHNKFTS